MTLLLVRHATSEPPTPGGPTEHERPLSPAGRVQAEALVDVLVPHAPTRIVSSPYQRALRTVQPTATALGLQVELDDDLREWTSGIGPTRDWQPHYRCCWDHPDEAVEGGEKHAELERRAGAAVRRALGTPGVTVLGSHGTWISRALLALGLPVDADFWFAMPMPAVYELAVTDRLHVRGPGLPS